MTKTHLNITIDTETYLAVKASGINISETIDNFFKNFIVIDSVNTEEENNIVKALEKNKKDFKAVQEGISQLSIALMQIQEEKRKTKEKLDQMAESMLVASDAAGLLERAAGKFL